MRILNKVNTTNLVIISILIIISFLLIPNLAVAADKINTDPSVSRGTFENIFDVFTKSGMQLQSQFKTAGLGLFFSLMTISMVWTFGQMVLRKADLAEFVSEFVKFCMFFGFFLALLEYAPSIVNYIQKYITGLSGNDTKMNSPVGIITQGFETWGKIANGLYGGADFDTDQSTGMWDVAGKTIKNVGASIVGAFESIAMIPTNFILMIVGIGVLIIHTILAIDLFVMQVALIMLSFMGMFLLGFGAGKNWTSDVAINYYKTVLAKSVEILVLLLICKFCAGVMDVLVDDIRMKGARAGVGEAMQVLVGALLIYFLGKSLPGQISSIIHVNSGGGGSPGGVGAAIVGAVGAVVASAAMGSAKMAGMQNVVKKGGGTNSQTLKAMGHPLQMAQAIGNSIKNVVNKATGKKQGSVEPGNKKESPQQTPLADANK